MTDLMLEEPPMEEIVPMGPVEAVRARNKFRRREGMFLSISISVVLHGALAVWGIWYLHNYIHGTDPVAGVRSMIQGEGGDGGPVIAIDSLQPEVGAKVASKTPDVAENDTPGPALPDQKVQLDSPSTDLPTSGLFQQAILGPSFHGARNPVGEPTGPGDGAATVAGGVPAGGAPGSIGQQGNGASTIAGHGKAGNGTDDPSGGTIYSVGPAGDNNPVIYPPEAVRRRFEGIASVQATIAPDGHVEDVKLFQSSGHGILDDAAIRSVREWVFTIPRDSQSNPCRVTVVQPVIFELRKFH